MSAGPSLGQIVRPLKETKTTVTLKRAAWEILLDAYRERSDYLEATKRMGSLQQHVLRGEGFWTTVDRREGWLRAMRDWAHVLDGVMRSNGRE